MQQYENKGILLGIIKYITDNDIPDNIIINNKTYKYILSELFNNYTFKKHGKGCSININNKIEGIVINNINNLTEVHADTITLLPYFSKPMILFRHDNKYKNKIEEFKDQIENFDKTKRYTYYTNKGGWDTYMENKIIKKYLIAYPYIKLSHIHQLLDNLKDEITLLGTASPYIQGDFNNVRYNVMPIQSVLPIGQNMIPYTQSNMAYTNIQQQKIPISDSVMEKTQLSQKYIELINKIIERSLLINNIYVNKIKEV